MNKKGAGSLIIILILIILLGTASYFLYLTLIDLYSEPIPFIQEKENSNNLTSDNITSFSSEFQFYPNMRFLDKEIKYNIDISCNEEKLKKIDEAMKKLETETSLLDFQETTTTPEIYFSCNENEPEIEENYFIAGEGGPVKIINITSFYVIEEGKVILSYKKPSCNNYNIELHELLHALGFQHSGNKKSIMYYSIECNQVLTQDIIDELKKLYSIQTLPDLTLVNVSAIKKGHYLDFSAIIKNKGLKNSQNFSLDLYSDEKKIDSFDLEKIKYGEGRILVAKDVTIPRKTNKIKFVINHSSSELNKENNFVELSLPT